MSVTLNDVDKIANLAKLKFADNEKLKLQKDLNKVLEYIDHLNELDLEGIEPLENINETENVLRKDEVFTWLTTEEALKNAPSKTGKFFKVPKVLDK
ncbi:MAG TPA: Asp-tRNA(Asn)/Glu-tRNA(Gln) amidotransferase subunit GatC [Ignavibacteria bacterium]|nr:Asp-tRNA(Asn)/Glu-tRNA(Gln) amidotransferase subunit GatC [Ignavibacteria bacterium]HMR39157.1 Asp-tRNA(Asn)/Glu-tRNA(Gln) amidotransferase subunit GatC [Ignavibacteria bacterium]